ncbi:MAG: flagellar hook-basal body complex protein, partial [Gammaproteobacteria bacterium]|nr:flagellar hook-basal body complex protein [Gammaproteobacteria bacterium]
ANAFVPANPQPDQYNNATSLTIYDTLGEEHLAEMYFRKTATDNEWDTYLQIDGTAVGGGTAAHRMVFSSSGTLTSPAMPLASYGTFAPGTGAADITNLFLNFTGTTQFGADFGVNALSQDGYTTGRLSGVDINDRGIVLARFSNGQNLAQGQVLMANFGNPQGLQPLGDTNWAETASSGAALAGGPGTASLGLVQAGALEESNVDLAAQLVNMIIAQRAFQA